MTAKTIVIEVKAETTAPSLHNPKIEGREWHGEPWSPQTDGHLAFLIAERLKGLHYEIKEIRD